ncbi:MAG: YbjN domain-containing protein [Vicinamibacterales bacterium]|nr:YbjN domain-containing protein [Vicinamibacterales bacterium]
MPRIDVLRPFVEKNLAAMLEVPRVQADQEGDYYLPWGSANIRVRLVDESEPLLQLSAVLVDGYKKSARMLDALNTINASELGFRVFRYERRILAAWEVPADTLDARQFLAVCHRFAEQADKFDSVLASRFGGKTALPDEDDGAVDA